MNQFENIRSIKYFIRDLQNMLSQTEGEAGLSAIELDLIKQKTREFYDRLLRMKFIEKKEIVNNRKNVADEKTVPQQAKAEIAPVPESVKLPQPEEKITPQKPEENQQATEDTHEIKPSVSMEEGPSNPPPSSQKTQKSNVASAFDLFSEPTSESLGESLAKTEQPAVAEKLQKTQIADLREAIGINDKFVFINQLFRGDMSRYNKTLDELNSLSSLKGAQTFMMELSVQYQWNEESPAFIKLNEIIERKFT